MNFISKKVFVGLSIVAVSSLSAEGVFSKHAIGTKVGTLGVGVEYTTNLMDDLDLRLGVNGFTYGVNGEKSDIDYDIDAQLLSVAAIADYHPFSNGFIVSAGLMYNGNAVDYTGKPTSGTYEINGEIYQASEIGSLDGKMSFNKVAPYLGIGYSSTMKSKGWHFVADAGVLYQGAVDTTLDVQCGSALTNTQCAALKRDVAAEEESFSKELKDYKWYPVLSVGVSYRF